MCRDLKSLFYRIACLLPLSPSLLRARGTGLGLNVILYPGVCSAGEIFPFVKIQRSFFFFSFIIKNKPHLHPDVFPTVPGCCELAAAGRPWLFACRDDFSLPRTACSELDNSSL